MSILCIKALDSLSTQFYKIQLYSRHEANMLLIVPPHLLPYSIVCLSFSVGDTDGLVYLIYYFSWKNIREIFHEIPYIFKTSMPFSFPPSRHFWWKFLLDLNDNWYFEAENRESIPLLSNMKANIEYWVKDSVMKNVNIVAEEVINRESRSLRRKMEGTVKKQIQRSIEDIMGSRIQGRGIQGRGIH